MAKKGKHNKIILTSQERSFLRDNFESMTNQELADALGLKITRTRHFLYEMGLKRMEKEYWSKEQVEFLKANYKIMGDTEIAEIFEKRWPKNKTWTKKHIDKKRLYLKLKRTPKDLELIKKRNKELGRWALCARKMWDTRGTASLGEVRIWKTSKGGHVKMVKTENGFVDYSREVWKKHHGEIPEGMVVTVKDGDPLNIKIENLDLIDRGELAQINKNGLFGMPPELHTTIKLIRKLKNEIKNEHH